jgi:hypothetical protein
MGFVCYRFRWQPDEFWRSTPHEIIAMVEAASEDDG